MKDRCVVLFLRHCGAAPPHLGTGLRSNDSNGLNYVEVSSSGSPSWNKAPNIWEITIASDLRCARKSMEKMSEPFY